MTRHRSARWSLALVALLLSAGAPAGEGAVDVQGHRGARGLAPENSMPAFRLALDLRVTTLELDLQSTRDGVLVVHHDPVLDRKRCGGPAGARLEQTGILELDWSDLRTVQCGLKRASGFPEQRAEPTSVPRLEEVLELARSARYPVRLNIEIKLQTPSLGRPVDEVAAALVPLLQQYELVERSTVQSFHEDALAAVARLEPGLDRSLLVRSRGDWEAAMERAGANILSPKHTALRQPDVELYRSRGIPVIPWTVNEPKDIRRMLDWGVDGIISDYPDRVLKLLAEP